MTCVIVVAILLVMLSPVYTQIVRRIERVQMHDQPHAALHGAANLYLQEHRMWPQVATKGVDAKTSGEQLDHHLATLWNSIQINWICPTQQKLLQNPDLSDPINVRIDYIATPFDRQSDDAHAQWSTSPGSSKAATSTATVT